MPQSLLNKLEPVLSNNQSGSSLLLEQLQDTLLQHYLENPVQTGELQKACSEVIKNFPDFMVMHHFLDYLTTKQAENEDISIGKAIEAYQNEWNGVDHLIAVEMHSQLPSLNGPVLFHSNSGTLQALAAHWMNQGIIPKIIQSIGRPAKEGIRQAKYLAKTGFTVKVIEDVAVRLYTNQIKAIFLGADCIGGRRFKNKTGSLFLGLLAEQQAIPVYVLADRRKQIPANLPDSFSQILEKETPKPGSELWQDPIPENIEVDNYYFEWAPNYLITKFVNEKGTFSPDERSNENQKFSGSYLTLLNALSAEIS